MDEPSFLSKSKVCLNIIVLAVINLDVYLVCQSRGFYGLFYESKIV